MNVKYTANSIQDLCEMRDLIILDCLIIPKLNNLFNICRYCMNVCVYMYYIYTVYFVVVHNYSLMYYVT